MQLGTLEPEQRCPPQSMTHPSHSLQMEGSRAGEMQCQRQGKSAASQAEAAASPACPAHAAIKLDSLPT